MTDRSKPPEGYGIGGCDDEHGEVYWPEVDAGSEYRSEKLATAACWTHAEAQREIGRQEERARIVRLLKRWAETRWLEPDGEAARALTRASMRIESLQHMEEPDHD